MTKFKPRKITLKVEYGADGNTVTCEMTELVPGLCYGPGPRYVADGEGVKWAVLHVASGLLLRNFTRRKDCVTVIREIAPLGDWTKPAGQLDLNTLIPSGRFIRAFEQNASVRIPTGNQIPAGHTFEHKYCTKCQCPLFIKPGESYLIHRRRSGNMGILDFPVCKECSSLLLGEARGISA